LIGSQRSIRSVADFTIYVTHESSSSSPCFGGIWSTHIDLRDYLFQEEEEEEETIGSPRAHTILSTFFFFSSLVSKMKNFNFQFCCCCCAFLFREGILCVT
jgi:hypothetical protein